MTALTRPAEVGTVVPALDIAFNQIEKLLPVAMGTATLTWPGGQYFSNALQITHGQPRQVLGVIAVPTSVVNFSEFTILGGPGATQQQWQIQGFEVTHTNQAATTSTVFWVAFGSR